MKTEYEHIYFKLKEKKPKTSVYACHNKKSGIKLGEVLWYSSWRQYCFLPTTEIVFSSGCMNDVIDFISQLEAERKGVLSVLRGKDDE